uniref:Uncharacterized protein n=1 Tax=Arundo donax TaxID=35708 RepID=A0A0A9BWK8_ARUDO
MINDLHSLFLCRSANKTHLKQYAIILLYAELAAIAMLHPIVL